MHLRQICFGLGLALGLPALQAGAETLQVFGGPVGGGCNNFICYSGAPAMGTLSTTLPVLNGPAGTPFMNYNASVTGRGLFADFSLFGFNSNRGNLTLSSTDRFTVNQIGPGGATTADIAARLRVTGQFGVQDSPVGEVLGGSATARAFFSAPRNVPGVTILEEGEKDKSVTLNLLEDAVVLPPAVGVDIRPSITLRVEVGRAFDLEKVLSLSMNFAGQTDDVTGGAAFGESALISFLLPEGFYITSVRGYSQGLPPDPGGPGGPAVIPLPAGVWLLLSAVGLLGWTSRRHRRSLAA